MPQVQPRRPFRRVVLKLGGEMFGGGERGGEQEKTCDYGDREPCELRDAIQSHRESRQEEFIVEYQAL